MKKNSSRKQRILIIEDDSLARNILGNLLKAEGYAVMEEEDGAKGLERAVSELPDLVILDIILPRMSGFEVCKAIRKNPDSCTIPILMATALEGKEDVIKGLKSGANDYITKPISPVEILARIKVNLDQKVAVDNLRDSASRFRLASELLEATTSSLDLRQVLFIVVTKAAEALAADRCSIILVEGNWGEAKENLTARVLVSNDNPELNDLTIELSRYPEVIEAFRTGQMVLIGDVESDPLMNAVKERILPLGFNSIMAVPLAFRGEVMGALLLRSNRQGRVFNEDEIITTRIIAGASANAMKNATLYRILENRTEKLERINEDLRKANEDLVKLNQIKSDFVSMVSHELRTPLTSIIGFSELLAEAYAGELNPEQNEYARQILRKSKELLSLINDLLDTGRLESGRMSLSFRPVDLGNILQSVFSSTRHVTGVPPVFKSHIPDDLPEFDADAGKITQILVNLVTNALKFSPPGSPVEVRAKLIKGRRETDRGDLVQISVTDRGVGIPEDLHQRIFEQFFQGNHGATRAFKGAGLGLYISKSLVEMHGGKIWLESSQGHGSTFHFTVPLRQN